MKIGLVCSHGGHLTEMKELEKAFDGHELFYITYKSNRTLQLHRAYLIENFAEKIWTFPFGFLHIVFAILKEKPKMIVSTGAEIAAPAFLIASLLRIPKIYIEGAARINSPSGTGRLVYPISDYFFVQWKGLLKVYGRRARYEGGLL